jgi:bifunctional non-homologous end joining protein LigD
MDFPKALAGSKKLKSFIRPMLASRHQQPFNDKNWIAEIKYDGYRAIASTEDGVKLYSRNGTSYLKAFPKVVRELENLDEDIILDGEIVAFENSKPSFNALQNYNPNSKAPIYYYVFDCLFYRGVDLRKKTLLERKAVIQKLFDCEGIIRFCDHVDGDKITTLYHHAQSLGLEGIIAKHKKSTYVEGDRSKQWLKVKNYIEDDFFIIGYGTKEFSLLLGQAVQGELIFRGEVGTGWTDKLRNRIFNILEASVTNKPALKKIPRIPAAWVHPQYMCRVKYLEFTKDGQVRHSVFLKLH